MRREEILERIRRDGGLPDLDRAIRAARAVVCGLLDRLSPEEADNLRAALQGDFDDLLQCRHPAHVPPARARDRLTEPEMVRRVCDESGLPDPGAARRLVRIVLGALSDRLGEEERQELANVARDVGSLRSRREEGDDE